MQRSWVWVAIVVAAVACSKKPDKAPPVAEKGSAKVEAEAAPSKKPDAERAMKIDGPSVTPVKTASIAFVVPKDSKFWGEMSFACYRAAMSLTGTHTAGEAFEKMSPTVPEAMRAGDIDLGRDMAALGGFECQGSPCLYVAATLNKPELMGKVLATLLPGTPQKMIAPNHYTIDTAGTTLIGRDGKEIKGTRTIHVRVVPIQWTEKPTGDAWVTESGRATHVVFIGGVDGKNADVDPVTLLADAATGLAHVEDAEGVLADARGRCILGRVGATDFQRGFALDRGRFAMSAAPGKDDALMAMLDSKRTLDLGVELTLSPAPKDADAKKWIAQGRAWAGNIATPIRAQFAGNPMLDAYIDMLALLGERGFKHQIAGKALTLSWRTDRVPRADLDALEKRFSALLGQ